MVQNPEEHQKATLDRIGEVWKKFPHLRLGQLLINCLPNGGVPYYASDLALCEMLEEYKEKHT
jgi:hypothetical protein